MPIQLSLAISKWLAFPLSCPSGLDMIFSVILDELSLAVYEFKKQQNFAN